MTEQKTVKTKNITINDLGCIISRLETRLVKRMDGLESRIDGLESGLGSLGKRIDDLDAGLNKRIDDLEKNMDYRFNGIQGQLDGIYLNYTTRHEHGALEGRVKKVERKIGMR